MRAQLFSLTLLGIGLLLVVTGVSIVVYKGVELGYTTYTIMIPEYRFETMMPGNYTKVENYAIELATITQDTSKPVNWIYSTTSLPWRNCTGARRIGVGFVARLSAFYNETPRLNLVIYGCHDNACELLVSSDLMVDAIVVREMNTYSGKKEYELQNGILDYEYFNITLTPIGLVVEDFFAGSQVTCFFQYEVTAPVLTFKGYNYRPYFIAVPMSANTSWLQIGIALSIAGLTIMIASLYVLIARKTKP